MDLIYEVGFEIEIVVLVVVLTLSTPFIPWFTKLITHFKSPPVSLVGIGLRPWGPFSLVGSKISHFHD